MLLPLIMLLASACLLSFAWALQRHFRRDGRMPRGMRLLSHCSVAAFTVFAALACSRSRPGPDTAAALLFAASLMLFWWTIAATRGARLALAHSAAGTEILHDRGPYAHVRHPFYASYLLFWIGTAIAAGPFQCIPVAILAAWYVALARREETRLQAGTFGADYSSYRRRTGMLFPRLSTKPAS